MDKRRRRWSSLSRKRPQDRRGRQTVNSSAGWLPHPVDGELLARGEPTTALRHLSRDLILLGLLCGSFGWRGGYIRLCCSRRCPIGHQSRSHIYNYSRKRRHSRHNSSPGKCRTTRKGSNSHTATTRRRECLLEETARTPVRPGRPIRPSRHPIRPSHRRQPSYSTRLDARTRSGLHRPYL